jgi:hypothetical protein
MANNTIDKRAEAVLETMKKRGNDYKTESVLRHLITHKRGLTPATAWERYGVYRLAVIIYNLRGQGIEIDTIEEATKNKNGDTFARYILHVYNEKGGEASA